MYRAHDVTNALRWLEPQSRGTLAVVCSPRGEVFDVQSFRACKSCNLPGLDVGQVQDLRFSTNGPEGLHAQIFPDGHIEFHLDAADACRDLVMHGAKDTKMVEGAGAGLLVGGALCLLTGGTYLAAWLAAGAVAGGAIGANISARPRWRVNLRDVLQPPQPTWFMQYA